jgi:hypothetical protein
MLVNEVAACSTGAAELAHRREDSASPSLMNKRLHSSNQMRGVFLLLACYGSHSAQECAAYLTSLRMASIESDLGRSIGRPSARSQTSCDNAPIARLVPNVTV